MASTQCSECDEEIEIPGRARLGQKIICSHCGAQLEVVATDPLEVEIAQEDDELWAEDDLDEDELDDLDELDEEEEEDDLDDLDDLDDGFDLEDDYEDDDFDDDFDDFDSDEDGEEDDDDDRW
jgi:lysine biosynthesis protein LysW